MKRFRLISCIIGIQLLVASFSLTGVSAANDTNSSKVVVVRDATEQAKCFLKIGGVQAKCAPGSVLWSFDVSEAEARANGEDYVKRTGDHKKDIAAITELMHKVNAKVIAANKQRIGSTGAFSTLLSLLPKGGYSLCGDTSVTGGYLTSPDFPGQPGITYTAYYTITGSGCNVVNLTRSTTGFATSGSAWFNQTAVYNGSYYTFQDISHGGANLPYTSNNTVSNQNIGNYFVDQVQSCSSGCASPSLSQGSAQMY